jgi:hypothetical protein
MRYVLPLLLLASPAFAQSGGEIVGGHARVWWPTIHGKFTGSTDTFQGTEVDVHDDLGLSEADEPFLDFGVWLKIPLLPVRFIFETYGGEFSGSSQLQRTVVIEGQPYVVGTTVNTHLNLRTYTIMVDIGFDFGASPVQFGFGIQIGAQVHDDKIDVTGTGVQVDQKLQGPIPLLGVRGSVTLFGSLEGVAVLRGITTFGKVKDLEASYLDFTVEVRYWIMNHVAAGAGYRLVDMLAKRELNNNNQDRLDLGFDGVFVSVLVKF